LFKFYRHPRLGCAEYLSPFKTAPLEYKGFAVTRRALILGVVGGLALGAAAHAAKSEDLNLVGAVAPILNI
jgi:hypothetical protein